MLGKATNLFRILGGIKYSFSTHAEIPSKLEKV